MEDEREEGEIVDLNDDDIYENIISSDEVDEDCLRQRIEELEAKNSELEKIASISKTHDYGCGSSNFIDLVDGDDDDESYYRQPSKYDYSSYTSSRKRSRRRKPCRHECKKSKRHKPYKTERRKKPQPNRTKDSDSSSDDEFQLDRNKLQAALKRNTSSSHSSTLKRKLIGVSKTVEDFIKAKEDVADEDISTSIEIMHLLNKITNDKIAPENTASISEEETESCLNEQELRIIALKSAILKKAEARKKRKIIETQPYSPTDTDIVMENVIVAKGSTKTKDELVNMEISPAVSPTIQDGSHQPIDMELESDDESERVLVTNNRQDIGSLPLFSKHEDNANIATKDLQNSIVVPVPDEISLSTAIVPERINQINTSSDSSQQLKLQEEEEEQALRALALAGLQAAKKRISINNSQPIQKPLEDSLPSDKSLNDASSEAEHLRNQVFSSIQKRRNMHRQLLPNPFAQKFSVQLPKPMEMTMPQITSNLKEALKRIKEMNKQNAEADATSNGKGIKTDTAKVNPSVDSISDALQVNINKIKTSHPQLSHHTKAAVTLNVDNDSDASQVNVNKNKKSQPEMSELKKAAVTLKADSISDDSQVNVNKTKKLQPEFSMLKKAAVTLNADNKSKKSQPELSELKKAAFKLNGDIVSNKDPSNESTIVEKKSIEIISKANVVLKNVTCNNSSVESKSKDTTVPLVISNKIESGPLEKTDTVLRSLKTIAQKKAIAEPHISLNQKENQELRKVVVSPKRVSEDKLIAAKKVKLNNARTSRVITTAVEKPVKKMIIQLNNSDTESDDLSLGQPNIDATSNHKSYSGVASPVSHSFSPSSPGNVIDGKSSDAIATTTDSFQRKLDEYLKSARTKVEQTKQETKTIKKSPSLVSHLPPSSQLEYRKLLNRMALLEKQKSLKMGKLKVIPHHPKSQPSNIISVTIKNDLSNHQPKSNDQIVQTNGIDVISSMDKTDKSVIVQGVESEIRKEKDKSPRTSMETVTANNEINSKNQNLNIQVTCHEPKKSASIKPKPAEKSINSLQHFSELSASDKNKLLQKTEWEYMNHSQLYLVDLNNMSLLVNKARVEKEKQFQMESEIEELESKIRQLQTQLAEKKLSVSKLYPIISASHKNIMKKRSKSLQLNKKCYLVGSKIVGPEYKIPDDPKADIAEKVKSLSSETKLLRNMKKPPAGEMSTSNLPIKEGNALQKEVLNHTPTASPAANENSSEKPVEKQQSSNNCTLNIPKPLSTMIQYKSPLDHMQNIGVTNPDSIVCPFQLLGQCEDKECTYQHLS